MNTCQGNEFHEHLEESRCDMIGGTMSYCFKLYHQITIININFLGGGYNTKSIRRNNLFTTTTLVLCLL